MSTKSLRLPAPAKLNLMLRVVGRRDDGYHLLQTVFQFIDRCDWITLDFREDGRITRRVPIPGVPEEQDLTLRAAQLLKTRFSVADQGATISVEKNLPMGGGLGGGSSDAATVLLGLNTLWDLKLPLDTLAELGLTLGADVPVFVRGYAAWAEGVGEFLTPLDELPEPWYVVAVPACHVATGVVFGSPGLTRNSKPIRIGDFVSGDRQNDCLTVVASLYPEVASVMGRLSKISSGARLTGTGACVFADFETQASADLAAEALFQQGISAFVTKGMNVSSLRSALDGKEKN